MAATADYFREDLSITADIETSKTLFMQQQSCLVQQCLILLALKAAARY
ncbi:hypothetical protein N9Z31_02710 [Pseudomonadales bacterium]|jgi:hypothetical protein|nr:hypothetical protein [Pseudomonadales bacterium]